VAASALTIGMLGGMSWESSAEYYRLANELVRERLGGLHSARLISAPDSPVPVFPSGRLHVEAAVDASLARRPHPVEPPWR
jgi:aspartate/glutamate racemase